MKNLLFLLLLWFSSSGLMAQNTAYSNQTIFESLSTLSPTLYNYTQTAADIFDVLNQSNYSITLLLPTETALNASIVSGKLNFSKPASANYNILSFFILNGSHTQQSFQSERKFYTTLQPSTAPVPVISIGPLLTNDYQTTKNISLYSSITKANMLNEIQCRNGLIQIIDNFLQPAETPLTTISILPETEHLEGLLKSLNISDTVSGTNKTILAPINEAWSNSTIPFGTLVHDLRYLVINGIYTSDQLIRGTLLPSDYRKLSIQVSLNNNALVINQDKAKIVMTDILTTNGVIHLIDTVINADAELTSSRKDNNGTTITTTSGSPVPADSSSSSDNINTSSSHQTKKTSSSPSSFPLLYNSSLYSLALSVTLLFLL